MDRFLKFYFWVIKWIGGVMRSINPLLDRVETSTPLSIPSRLCEKKPLVPRQNIVKPVLGVLSGKK